MKHSIAVVLVASLAFGCGSKDSDKPAAAGDKPAATAPASAAAPPAAGPAATPGTATAADLPAECKQFTDAMERLMKCDALKASRDEMRKGYQQMLDAMIKLGDKKAMVDGCKMSMDTMDQALKTAGC